MELVTRMLVLLGTELFWNLIIWLPTLLFSMLFIRLLLGIRPSELVAEIEEHQTAAVGAVVFWSALGFSMLAGKAFADPSISDYSIVEALLWLSVGTLIALLIFLAGVVLVFGALARRHQQSLGAYIQRELRTEHNLSLSFIMGALFIVPIVVAYHMTV